MNRRDRSGKHARTPQAMAHGERRCGGLPLCSLPCPQATCTFPPFLHSRLLRVGIRSTPPTKHAGLVPMTLCPSDPPFDLIAFGLFLTLVDSVKLPVSCSGSYPPIGGPGMVELGLIACPQIPGSRKSRAPIIILLQCKSGPGQGSLTKQLPTFSCQCPVRSALTSLLSCKPTNSGTGK